MNVLVVSGGGFQGLTVLKGLRLSADVRIILADSLQENIGKYFVDVFHLVPEIEDTEGFVGALLDICRAENVRLVIPATERELGTLAAHRRRFAEREVAVAVSEAGLLQTLSHKRQLYEFLQAEGLPTLPMLDIASAGVSFPVIGKPARGWGGRGVLVFHSREDMQAHPLADLTAGYVWQPFLPDFDEYSVDFAIGFDGSYAAYVMRKRVRTSGGFAVLSDLVRDDCLEPSIQRFIELIGQRGACGIFNLQVLKAQADYYFSDVNPRMGTSAVFGYGLGLNYPLFMCNTLTRPAQAAAPPQPAGSGKIRMVRYLDEFWIETPELEQVRGIVFDLDDTLINQKRWIANKLKVVAANFDARLPAPARFLPAALRILEEGNRSRLFDALAEELGFDPALTAELIEAYRQADGGPCPLYPDALPGLAWLRQSGYKLALVTDNPPRSQQQKVSACDLADRFEAVVYARELNLEKPSAEVFQRVAALLDLPPQSLVMVGDNLYRDLAGALDAGFAHAFLVARPGGLFNFDREIFEDLFPSQYKFTPVADLRNLQWYLSRS